MQGVGEILIEPYSLLHLPKVNAYFGGAKAGINIKICAWRDSNARPIP